MRKVLAIIALLCAFAAPATAVDYPQLDGRVVDEARLLSDGAKRALENKLANLEAHASKQLIVVTLASARGMTVDDYGLALRKQWGLEVNGKRVMLIVGSTEGRSVIQYDTSLKGYARRGRHRAHSRTDDEAALQRRRLSRRRDRRVRTTLIGALIRAPSEPALASAPVRVAQADEIRCRRRRSIRRSPAAWSTMPACSTRRRASRCARSSPRSKRKPPISSSLRP